MYSSLLLFSFLLVKYLFFLCCVDFGVFNSEDIREDLVFSGIIILLMHTKLFQNKFFKKTLLLFYTLYFILETTSYLAVSSTFSSSYMYLLIDSGSNELKDFAESYFSWQILFAFVVYAMLFLKSINYKFSNKFSNLKGLGLSVLLVVFLKLTGLIESNAYHNVVRGTYGYYVLQNKMQISESIPSQDLKISSENEIMVLVLGESTDRNRMQIYGYERETTPELNSIRDELYVFNNVISTEVFTLKAVPKIITTLNSDTNKAKLIDVIQLLKSAGYDTYWLSNQRPISYHDNAVSRIAAQANELKFFNHQIDRDAEAVDEILLPDYKRILNKSGKKLIVLRLIGTHFDYDKRYPKHYNIFDTDSNLSKKERLRNQYDNAVLYNDFILSTIVNELKKQGGKSAMLYVADHGENIYDDGVNFFGRSEEIVTKSMFTIPFIFWKSDSFELPDDFIYKNERPFTADYTLESLGHVFGVQHKTMKNSESIFSSKYSDKPRVIVGNKNFDTFFKN